MLLAVRQAVVAHQIDAALAEVQRTYAYAGKPPETVAGRGGTSVDPVFAWLRASPERWDGCIYLTDGELPAPEVKPPCPVLWVLAPGARSGEHLRFGRVVTLRDPEGQGLGERRR